MNPNTSVAIRHDITPDTWAMMQSIAPTLYESRLFGVASSAQAAAILLKGAELGFGPAASFEFIHMIQGKPGLSPRGALAILHSSPAIRTIDIQEITDPSGVYQGHKCTITRSNGFSYTAKFTLADAQRAGLMKSGGAWEAYPRNMCLWRAVGFAADVAAPDLTAGATLLMKAPEQFGVGISEEGNVIEGQVSEAAEPSLLDRMVADLGAEKVLEASGGTLPSTDTEINELATKLFYEISF